MKLTESKLRQIIRGIIREGTVQISRDVDADFRGNMVQLIGRKAKVPLSKRDLKALIYIIRKHMGRSYTEDVQEGFGDKFGKMMNSYDIKIVQNALAMAKQQAPKDIHKSSEKTPKLIAITIINRMKAYRNKVKAPNLKKEFQKAIDKLEKDYKKIKEGKLTEGKRIKLPSGIVIDIGMNYLKVYNYDGKEIPFDKNEVLKFIRASRQQMRLV